MAVKGRKKKSRHIGHKNKYIIKKQKKEKNWRWGKNHQNEIPVGRMLVTRRA